MLLQAFLDTPNWIYNIYIKNIADTFNMSVVSLAAIFLTTVEYGTSLSRINSNELFIWVFSHFIRRWLVGAGNAIGSSCSRLGTFSIDDNNLK